MKRLALVLACLGILTFAEANAEPVLSRLDIETIDQPQPLVCIDLDNDGDLDLATVSHGGAQAYLAVHKNFGNGTFMSPIYTLVDSLASGGITDVAAGDLDQDSTIDLVISSQYSPTISVYYGNGDGTFADAVLVPTITFVTSVVLTDFTNDGWLDIGTMNTNVHAKVEIFRSTNSGRGFLSPISYFAGENAFGMRTADLNSDGWQDVVVSNWTDAKFSVLLGDGAGGLLPYTQYNLPNWSYGIVIADLVGSNALDVAATVTNYQGSTGSPLTQIRIYAGSGDGALTLVDSIPAGNNPLAIVAAQIEGDVALDLLWVCGDDNTLQIARNDGELGFATPVNYSTALEPFDLVIADLDGSGKNDVVVSARGNHVLCVFQNEGPVVCTDADFDGFGDPGHPENECADDNCPSVYNPDQADWDNNGVGDACTPTDTGTNVVIQTTANTTITFDSVSAGGTTGTTTSPSGPTPPANLGIVPLGSPTYFSIYSSVSFQGLVQICITYNDSDVVGEETLITMLHYHNGVWNDITATRDTSTNTLCGMTDGFSYFAIAEACCFGNRGDVNSSGNVNVVDIVFLVQYLFYSGTTPACLAEANVNGINNINVVDIVFLVQYLFNSGPLPATCS